ncbi:hydrolase 76 protein [Phlyctochytrium planicorne]|nr:hydrolase 76 protein [Phlyctochytrium planicorne]
MQLSITISLLALLPSALGATLDVKNADAVTAALKAAMPWLSYHFSTPGDGAWEQTLVQWHESGEFWNCYLDYKQTTGDSKYDAFYGENLRLASFGDNADFLGGKNRLIQETLYGKWNDDIAWWGLTAVTGAEVNGPKSLIDPTSSEPSGSWFTVADFTLQEMFEQYDQVCGGGIYWSRNRLSQNEGLKAYKSVISNVQAIQLASRLLRINPSNSTYKDWADKTYAWLQSSTLMSKDFRIADGVTALNDSTCGPDHIDFSEWSYQPGVLMSGLAYMYEATKDEKYYTQALGVFDTFQRIFVRNATSTPVSGKTLAVDEVWEPQCDVYAFPCKDPGGYTWAAFRGMTHMYRIFGSKNEAMKTRIRAIIEASVNGFITRCNDQWNCIRTLNPVPKQYTFPNGTNPRDQIEAVILLNSLAAVRDVWAVPFGSGSTPSPSSGGNKGGSSASVENTTPTAKSSAARKAALPRMFKGDTSTMGMILSAVLEVGALHGLLLAALIALVIGGGVF